MDIIIVLSIGFFTIAPLFFAFLIEMDRREFERELEEEFGTFEEEDG